MLKAVIFDVGGVLIRTHSRTGREKWATRLGITAPELEDLVFNSPSGQQRQLGQKTDQEHWAWLGTHLELSPSEQAELRHDFFAGDKMNESLLEYAQRLKQAGYRLGLLSNYGDDARHEWTEIYPFLHHFEGIIISAEVGMMKPEAKIYHLAADSLDVALHEALFIDDFIENVEGAKQAGMPAIHFSDPECVQQMIAIRTQVSVLAGE